MNLENKDFKLKENAKKEVAEVANKCGITEPELEALLEQVSSFGISGRIKESHKKWHMDKWYKFWTLRRVRVIDDFELNSIDIIKE